MNAKKAKALRLVARTLVANHNKTAAEGEQIPDRQHGTVRNTSKDIFIDVEGDDGKTKVEKVHIFDGRVVNSPKSMRAVYQQLKKSEAKNG